MASKYWIKLYHEMLDDPKVARLNDSTYRRFIECLLLAGELDENGLLPPLEDMAWKLRLSETALTQDMTRLALSEMVELKQTNDGERWFVSKFAERQAPSTAAYRMHEMRKRKRKEPKEKEIKIQNTDTDTYTYQSVTHVTSRNENVTQYEHTNQEHIDTITAICNVVKGENPLMPSEQIDKFAHYLEDRNEVNRVPGFTEWWNSGNGYYNGRPALKSFIQEWQNYLDGIDLTVGIKQQSAPGAAMQAAQEYAELKARFGDGTGNN